MDQDRRPEWTPEPKSPPWWAGVLLVFAAPVILALGFSIGRQVHAPAKAGDTIQPVTDMPDTLFRGWGKPDLAIMISGQTFGYLQPCGCSAPQKGGLVRRYNVFQLLEKKGWRMAGIDLGEIYPNKALLRDIDGNPKVFLPDQAKEKFKTTLRALEWLNYQDFGLGVTELKMPLINGLSELGPLNIKKPRPLSLDLQDPDQILQNRFAVRSYDVIGAQAKVGVSSLVARSVAKDVAGIPNVAFNDNASMIRALLPAFAKEKVDFTILFVHGNEEEAIEIAKLCKTERQKLPAPPNSAIPDIDIIVHTSDFETPPSQPQEVKGTNTRLLYMGHKGIHVGVLGLFRKAKPAVGFDVRYELITLTPEFETPKNKVAGHPVMKIIEEYSQTVKDSDFLSAYLALRESHPTQRDPGLIAGGVEAKYVGTQRCGSCHQAALQVWAKSGHSHAFKALEDVKNPSLRQYDPECVACHTVGFKYRTGYYDPPAGSTPNQLAKHNEKLVNVGCESCHGPGSMHANNPNNKAYLPLINPIKLANNPNGMQKLDFFCQKCHDIENDVHWGNRKPVNQSWNKIAHPEKKAP